MNCSFTGAVFEAASAEAMGNLNPVMLSDLLHNDTSSSSNEFYPSIDKAAPSKHIASAPSILA